MTLRLSFCLLRFYSAIVFLLFAQLFHCKRICVDRLCEFGKNCLFFLSAVEFGCVMVVVFITTSFLYFIRSRIGS